MAAEEKRVCRFRASEFGRRDLEHFVEVLRALGLDVECEFSASGKTASVTAAVPASVLDAKWSRTRLAGRPRNPIVPPAGSLFTPETTVKEFLAWQEGHTAAEGMAQLGLKRTTYYERMRDMRALDAEQDRVNASRDRDPNWTSDRRISYTLGSVRRRSEG